MVKVLVVLADGFEETEALVPVDFLRRAGAEVSVAGLSSRSVCGSHGIRVCCDVLFSEVSGKEFDALVLPGGMPGASNLASSSSLCNFIVSMNGNGRLIAAICASPAVVLGPLGVLSGKKAVCYPGTENYSPSVKFYPDRVIHDKNIVTARGAGCAVEFSLEIVSALFSKDKAEELALSVIHRTENL
ncbi:MAG: DJ-1/PfpI family protein [Sphaerochaetaceae bacterium]|nr:DJ-1/PfpI family protein [Sphaerochaetaceae bacterium]